MSGEAVVELNRVRETWCQVDVKPQQSWDRTQRRHYRQHLKTSTLLLKALTGAGAPLRRSVRSEEPPPPPPPAKLPERRHFRESRKTQLV
ncbi:hypothetical protein JOB18_000117 [Solea senegalensis]|uniref:Uncharacterized protein n=1 Tax=Solea senegalensis TaxID=28829 RepID=A0AAV6RUS0_SOLSE|nr:hypothetical protein JOB18_000117 [Solea senegalensis]